MNVSKSIDANKSQAKGTLGTFGGVFTPSILTILGIILFLRLGYVVGQGGLWQTLIILFLANGISVLTTISLAAIATSLTVKGGGDYFLISRTLGLEFGGAIGLVLFLAQSVSIAFYCIGFGEVITGIFQVQAAYFSQMVAAGAVVFLFIFAWLGADWATRLQYVVMAVLVAALVSFFIGGLVKWDSALIIENWTAGSDAPGFWVLFAIFFPAVTGFTQGVSMSGDLKDPEKSLPIGTFMAVGLSLLIYFFACIIMAASLPKETLIGDYNSMQHVAVVDFLIVAGVVAATLSSAMASFMGAPRILQSLSGDRIFPVLNPFVKGVGASDNPRRGVLLSGAIALCTIAIGKLNLIAPIVSMFFLVSYGLLNYATFFEARSGSHSFRPRFKYYDYRVSLVGGAACLVAMLAINVAAGVVAIAFLAAIYQYLKRTAGPSRWADSRRSYHLKMVRQHLFAAAEENEHPRNWRPQLLIFTSDIKRRRPIIQFASWLQGGSGISSVVQVLEGKGAAVVKVRETAAAELKKYIKEEKAEMFPLVISTPDLEIGIHALIQSHGIGPVRPNTILANWIEPLPRFESDENARELGRYMRIAFRQKCNIVLLNTKAKEWENPAEPLSGQKRIDVWWVGDASSRLMLLFAYILRRHPRWQDARIRVLDMVYEKTSEKTVADLEKSLSDFRIDAVPEIVPTRDTKTVVAYSADAALVFFPFLLKNYTPLDPFGNSLDLLFTRLPAAVSVLAAMDIDLEAEPDEGGAADLAAAKDAFYGALKKTEKAEQEAHAASKLAEEKLIKLQAAALSNADEDTVRRLNAEALSAKEEAVKAARKAAKWSAKVINYKKDLEKMGEIVSDG
jgi:amino acid transporter